MFSLSAAWRRPVARAIALIVVAGCAVLAACTSGHADPSARRPSSGHTDSTGAVSGIQAATSTSVARDGTFSDPYPVASRAGDSSSPTFFGSVNEALTCSGQLRPDCYRPTVTSVGYSTALETTLRKHGLTVEASKAHHPFELANGSWQMAFAARVKRSVGGSTSTNKSTSWDLIFHAHPVGSGRVDGIPTHWVGDSVIVGSLDHAAAANYDGKYFLNDAKLYLIYQTQLSTHHFGIVAQLMRDPAHAASSRPVTLLEPGSGSHSLNSENFAANSPNGIKLNETGNIAEVDGLYVMVYSAGGYSRSTYKTGLAYSNTFLPAPGSTYRKLFIPDPSHVWDSPNGDEVQYLLQSQKPDWPNYTRSSVQAPGVGSIVKSDGEWFLFFAGYAPAEKATGPKHTFNPAHRRPFFVKLHIHIPSGARVSAVSDAQIARWITT